MYSGIYDNTIRCRRCQKIMSKDNFNIRYDKMFTHANLYCTPCFTPEFRMELWRLAYTVPSVVLHENPLLIETSLINRKIKENVKTKQHRRTAQ